mmetsp:Transcript_33178/g.82573  ORF Transcript_33178/g.82573 Transcript_33178/m.82573 type:complete len:570 (+) Transcript_33178:81-1790(+)
MGRILVLYHSNTDCTSDMAALVAQGARKIPGMVVRLRSCDEAVAEDVIWADGIACGTPTNLGGIAWRMKKWWDDFAAENWGKCDGKLCTVFSSQGGHGGGAEITCQAMSTVMMNFGFLSFGVSDYVSKIHTLHYGCVVAKRPRNDHDKAACDRLGLRLAEWVAYFVDGRKSLHPLLTTKADDAVREALAATAKAAGVPLAVPPPRAPVVLANPAHTVHVVVTKDVPEEAQDRWLEMAEVLAHHTWREAGCIKYAFIKSADSPTRFVIVEEWESEAHLLAHFATEHFITYVPQMDAISSTVGIDKCTDALTKRTRPGHNALVFTKACAFVHESIPAAAECLKRLIEETPGWSATISDESAMLETGAKKQFDVIVLVNNSGEIFEPSKGILAEHVAQGRGVLGVHAALACFLNGQDAVGGSHMQATTTVIRDIFGAHFLNHPLPQDGLLHFNHAAAIAAGVPLGASLPAKLLHHDEFFNFGNNPATESGVVVLATVNEATYDGGLLGAEHPIVWCRRLGPNKAPIFYSALGHFASSYDGTGPTAAHMEQVLRAGLSFVLTESNKSSEDVAA